MIVLYSHRDSAWKLTDFGISSDSGSKSHLFSEDCRGTSSYRAPEMLPLALGEIAKYDKKVDIWALGCILYEMATDRKAFQSDYATIDFSRTNPSIGLTFGEGFGENCQKTITEKVRDMFKIEPSSRPSAGELVHDFDLLLQLNSIDNASRVNAEHEFSQITLSSSSTMRRREC
jgi:serine/threonine protein kinase